ncbi:MAG TPA: MFS transporter [Pyrinomonadaceae bacterium]|jgi:ACS family hexuronate transporter-like MFS transporter|nr:MFS transporter [Pyrinomonadaceae bacterium]
MADSKSVLESTPKLAAPVVPVASIGAAIGRYRWVICALLFFATTINYIDRQVLGILATDEAFKHTIGWNDAQYGFIQTAFQGAYAVGLLLVGSLMDRFGTRKGFSFAVTFWSIAAMGHALARSIFGFGVARFALGLGEAGNFPAAIKTVAEWFPKKERALACGIFNSGSNVGAIVGPLAVPFIAVRFGWQWAFIVTGLLGFIWLAFWLAIYRRPEEHPKLSAAELAHIQSDPPEPTTKIKWSRLFPHRQTWAFAVGKFMTDPIWWVYLFWLPKFLNSNYGLNITQIGLPLVVIYVAADFGSIGGGWLSSSLIKRGWSVNKSRKTAMLLCAIAVTPIVFAAHASSLWAAVGFVSLAASAHQGWSANMFTMASDMFPRRAVGSVVGIGGMAGSVGGMLIQSAVGLILFYTGSYLPIFIIAGSTYIVALGIIHLLSPRLEPASVEGPAV